ncbi:MAG: ROK family protein [Candidatus Taylorbacteria bacterium]|nr:ROK family protein [Candidatus Taylorbacteria bacterium]
MEQGNIITIDIGASKIRFFSVNEKKEMTEYSDTSTVNLVGRELKNQELINLLADNIHRSLHNLKKEGKEALAISIGSPGSLDSKKGVILTPPNLRGIRNLAIVDELKKIFDLPVFLLNDADASLLGERWLREHRKLKNLIYLTLSTGVGSGILKNGELLGEKIELGHQPLAVENEQRLCSCEELNHAEAYLGTKGLAETYSKIFEVKESDLKPEEWHSISPKMRKGVVNDDAKWLAVQETYAKYLAIFLKNTFINFRPELIILGGGIVFGNKPLLAKTKEELKKLMADEAVNIELAESGHNVNLGAAKYAFDLLNSR